MAAAVGRATITYNLDVHSLSRRLNRMVGELIKSQSSGISQTMPFDLIRVKTYVSSLRSYSGHVVADPLLDLPETSPDPITLPVPTPIPSMENDSVWDLCNLFDTARAELENSQSSRLSTNLVSYDYQRLLAVLSKAESLIGYIETAEPMDLPESMPRDAMTGSGQQGV